MTSGISASGARSRKRSASLKPELAVHLGGNRLVLRGRDLFERDAEQARRLIDQAFALDQVRSIVLRRDRNQIGVELAPLADPDEVWPRLGALLRQAPAVADKNSRAARLDLDGPSAGLPVRVSRAGAALTTFRARELSPERLRISHPQLRQRAIQRRFAAFLRTVHGVSEARSVVFGAGVIVFYDASVIDAEHILRLVERSWAEITDLRSIAPTPRRLFVASGLLAFAFVAQFLRPLWLPWAVAAVALYSAPNLIAAARDLAHGRVGLPALYSAGLGFMLWSGRPFASGVMATLSQLWPSLANRLASESESRLFAEQRRQVAWARLADVRGGERLVGLDQLPRDASIVVRAGEYLPADGVVIEGRAGVDEDMLTGSRGPADKLAGDPVFAGAFVRDGALKVRVVRSGAETAAAALARALPRGALKDLPSSAEVEQIANRNAKPALAAAGLLLLATRIPRLSQAIIRPDYATAPRLSAHLSGLNAVAESLAKGALVRDPAALERLRSAEVFVFDDGVDLETREIEVAKINVAARAAAEDALALAAIALSGDDPRAQAVKRELDNEGAADAHAHALRRRAGQTLFWTDSGAPVSVAAPDRALAEKFAASPQTLALLRKLAAQPSADPAERPLAVARDHKIVGVVQFARTGERRLAQMLAALRYDNPEARFVRISSAPQDQAEAAVESLGFDAVYGDLSPEQKVATFQSLGVPAAWIGDGADSAASLARTASAVSISLSGLASLPRDEADIVLLRHDVDAMLAPRRAAAAHRVRLEADYRTVYLANLLAVMGGFAAGFGGLESGLTSNLGSAAVFLGRWRALAALASSAERRADGRRLASTAESALDRLSRRRASAAAER